MFSNVIFARSVWSFGFLGLIFKQGILFTFTIWMIIFGCLLTFFALFKEKRNQIEHMFIFYVDLFFGGEYLRYILNHMYLQYKILFYYNQFTNIKINNIDIVPKVKNIFNKDDYFFQKQVQLPLSDTFSVIEYSIINLGTFYDYIEANEIGRLPRHPISFYINNSKIEIQDSYWINMEQLNEKQKLNFMEILFLQKIFQYSWDTKFWTLEKLLNAFPNQFVLPIFDNTIKTDNSLLDTDSKRALRQAKRQTKLLESRLHKKNKYKVALQINFNINSITLFD